LREEDEATIGNYMLLRNRLYSDSPDFQFSQVLFLNVKKVIYYVLLRIDLSANDI
jgi:hypothetical protein